MDINRISIQDNKQYGILLINKPKWKTSHDIVDIVRKKFNIKKVGHAGALDPFATGLLIILIGKATKLSNLFLNQKKGYKATILLGLSTDSYDIEGKIQDHKRCDLKNLNIQYIKSKLESIQSGYQQKVPIFSSVKVNGDKLRILARKSQKFTINNDIATFYFTDTSKKSIKLPIRKVGFSKFHISNLKQVFQEDISEKRLLEKLQDLKTEDKFLQFDLDIECSKGTYIRQLAYDIGELLGCPALLLNLHRTKIGEFTIDQAIKINEINKFKP